MQMEQKEKLEKKSFFKLVYEWCCRREAHICTIVLAAVITYAIWPVLSAPLSTYPLTVDGMGHLTKIKYIADCLKDLNWPSWFPYWYNGTTVAQYYPPLSYFLLAPIQMVSNNIMVTFKLFGFFTLFIGGLGVWCTCHRFIGPVVGIWAGILYALQPYLILSLFLSGVIAQGPIFALSPWLLWGTLLFLEHRSPGRWIGICLLTACLVLSHPMHAFLVALAIAPLVIMLLVLGKINLLDFLYWGLAIALGAGLASFWWVIGVTQLETAGIPFLLPEAAKNYTADLTWYNPMLRSKGGLYFSLSCLLFACFSLFWIKKPGAKSLEKSLEKGVITDNNALIVSVFFALFISVLLSFGYHIPFFKYIPMSEKLVPGRILSFSAVFTAVLCAICIQRIIKYWSSGYWRLLALLFISIGILIIMVDINPHNIISKYNISCRDLQNNINLIPLEKQPFNNGRFCWVWSATSAITYFPMTKGLYMTDGWNIEGTPHNRAIWQHNIAIPYGCSDYVVRNLLYWNTRSAFISKQYTEVEKGLIERGFRVIGGDSGKAILYSPTPSSYFMLPERNALVIGKAAINLEMHFPWFARGYSTSLEEYPFDYLDRFRLIYLIEPEVNNFNEFQNVVEDLAGAGKTVIVEMGRAETWPVGDTYPYWEKIIPGSRIVSTDDSPFSREVVLDADPHGQAPVVGNMDEVWMEMLAGEKRIPALGYKNINGKPVYFVGLALGQQLTSGHGDEIKGLLEQLMDLAEPHKSIVPAAFPVKESDWGHDGFDFRYSAEKDTPVQVSVTYTPRWQATIDGKPLEVHNLENLILIDLPAGEHRVSFHYGMTWVGWLGIGLSIISLLFVIFIYCKFDDIDRFFNYLQSGIKKVVESIGA